MRPEAQATRQVILIDLVGHRHSIMLTRVLVDVHLLAVCVGEPRGLGELLDLAGEEVGHMVVPAGDVGQSHSRGIRVDVHRWRSLE